MAKTLTDYLLNPLYIIIDFSRKKDFLKEGKRNVLYFIINLILSFIITICGCVYNEFIVLFFYKLEHNTHYEIARRGLKVYRQVDVPLLYRGVSLKVALRMDVVVENRVLVELKSVEEMKKLFWKQTLTYLKLTGMHVGLLVNFNTDNITDSIHRIVN